MRNWRSHSRGAAATAVDVTLGSLRAEVKSLPEPVQKFPKTPSLVRFSDSTSRARDLSTRPPDLRELVRGVCDTPVFSGRKGTLRDFPSTNCVVR
jgi:hypothetical protein